MSVDVAFFDLDRTLIDCNSGSLWVQREWRARRIPLSTAVWASAYLCAYSLGYSRLEPVLERAGEFYKGTKDHVLRETTRAWFSADIAPRIRQGAIDVLRDCREKGIGCVLATSSSMYVASAACEAFGLDDFIATCLEVSDGVLTGRISTMAYGKWKLEAARSWATAHDVDLSRCSFYTDSVTDLPLLEAVGRPVVVHPDRKLARVAKQRMWKMEDWGRAIGRDRGVSGRTP